MIHDHYNNLARMLGEVVAGKVPGFSTMIVSDIDSTGCSTHFNAYDAFAAAEKVLISKTEDNPRFFTRERVEELKTSLNENGWVALNDFKGTRIHVVTGTLEQLEMVP